MQMWGASSVLSFLNEGCQKHVGGGLCMRHVQEAARRWKKALSAGRICLTTIPWLTQDKQSTGEHWRHYTPETFSSQKGKGLYQWTAVGHRTGLKISCQQMDLGRSQGIKSNCILSLGSSLGLLLLTLWGLFELGLRVLLFGSPSLAGSFSPSCLSCFPVSPTRALPASSLHSCQSHLCPTQPASKPDHHDDPLCNPVQGSGYPAPHPCRVTAGAVPGRSVHRPCLGDIDGAA